MGPPLTPILCDVDQSDTYIHITWIISEEDKVEHFQLHYSYTIRGCVGLNGTNYFVLSNITRSYNLSNLEENSDFFIALTAVNQAGKSNPATIQTYTLQAGEIISWNFKTYFNSNLIVLSSSYKTSC